MAAYQQLKTLLASRAMEEAFSRVYIPAQFDTQYQRFTQVLEEFKTRFD